MKVARTVLRRVVTGDSHGLSDTSDLWFPWQSYRASFKATSDWQTIRIPFSDLDAYKTSQKFRQNKLKRIGLVGIGRDFLADLCLASIRFYSEDN